MYCEVEFVPNGKRYDYTCQSLEVNVGDHVVVEVRDQLKVVKVVRTKLDTGMEYVPAEITGIVTRPKDCLPNRTVKKSKWKPVALYTAIGTAMLTAEHFDVIGKILSFLG